MSLVRDQMRGEKRGGEGEGEEEKKDATRYVGKSSSFILVSKNSLLHRRSASQCPEKKGREKGEGGEVNVRLRSSSFPHSDPDQVAAVKRERGKERGFSSLLLPGRGTEC